MRWRWGLVAKGLGAGAVAIVLGGVVGILLQPAAAFSREEMALRVAALWRYGAVDVPQQMAGADDPARDLMARVAAGAVLDSAESARYRQAIQRVLAAHQGLFALLDNNLCLVENAAPQEANNVGGIGIAGLHDWHAASAASNFDEMQSDLAGLATAGALRRIYLANEAYKDLTDLMVHLAPAMHSMVVGPAPALPEAADPGLADDFTAFRRAMTAASFAEINSADYLTARARALDAYTDLAMAVQGQITAQLSPLEQRVAGRWLALQGVQPRLILP